MRSLVDKQPIALVVIKGDHLVGEIADDDAGMAAAVVIRGISTHPGARHPILAEADPGCDSLLLEGSVSFVQVKFVWLRVVGDQDVRPAVAIGVKNRNAQALGGGILESGLLGGIFEFAATQVMPQTKGRSFVRFRSAVGFVRTINGAVEIWAVELACC